MTISGILVLRGLGLAFGVGVGRGLGSGVGVGAGPRLMYTVTFSSPSISCPALTLCRATRPFGTFSEDTNSMSASMPLFLSML